MRMYFRSIKGAICLAEIVDYKNADHNIEAVFSIELLMNSFDKDTSKSYISLTKKRHLQLGKVERFKPILPEQYTKSV